MAQAEGSSQKLPGFLAWSWQRKTGTIRPIAAIIFTSIMCGALTALPFNFLVQIFLIVRVFNLVCEYAALIRLRYTRPNDVRTFAVPGGLVGAWLLGIPTVALAVFAIVEADWQVWTAGAISHGAIIILYLVKVGVQKLLAKRRGQHPHPEQHPEVKEVIN